MIELHRPCAYRPEFVHLVPEMIEEGVLYVSLPLSVAIHRCACGCRNEVVTPLGDDGWTLRRKGTSVSLYPSIGNWSFPCRSHYFIMNSEAVWAAPATPEMIAASREFDNPRTHLVQPISKAGRIAAMLRNIWNALHHLWHR